MAAVVCAVAVCAGASFWWIYGSHLAYGPAIRADGTGYYLYLPALLLDGDITMERTAQRSFKGSESLMTGVRRVPPDDHYLDKYPVGEAMMIAPFFVVGDAAARVMGETTDGFSTPYKVAANAAGLAYALAGLVLLGLLLLRWFSRATVVVTLLAMTFGTALFHYATYDAVFSHAFSFFLVAAAGFLALSVYEKPRAASALALGLALGLAAAVRPTNAVLVLFVALVGVSSVREVRLRARALLRQPVLLAVGAAAFLLALLPQVAYWHAVTGRMLVYAYGAEHLSLLHPHLLDVLFSVRKGLFFWAPVLVLAVAGFRYLERYVEGLLLAAVAYLGVHAWVVASWETWWYGGSLGQRAFVETVPVFSLGLAALVEAAARSRVARVNAVAAVTLTTLLGVHAMIAYWLQEIPVDETHWETYLHSFRIWLPD